MLVKARTNIRHPASPLWSISAARATAITALTVPAPLALASRARSAFAATITARLIDRVRTRAARHRGFRVKNLAPVNPDFDAVHSEGRVRFGEPVVNVCA